MSSEYAVFPRGDLDLAAVSTLEREWWEVIDRYHPQALVIDLSDVSFLDCSGIGVLMRAYTRQRAHGGRLEVRSARGLPRRVLAIAGVDVLLGVSRVDMGADPTGAPRSGSAAVP